MLLWLLMLLLLICLLHLLLWLPVHQLRNQAAFIPNYVHFLGHFAHSRVHLVKLPVGLIKLFLLIINDRTLQRYIHLCSKLESYQRKDSFQLAG